MNSGQPVTGIPVAIGYDPKKLEVGNIVEGEFLKQGGTPTSFQVRADPAAGQIYVTDTYTGDGQSSVAGATGQGAVLMATFKPISSANPSFLRNNNNNTPQKPPPPSPYRQSSIQLYRYCTVNRR